MSIQNIPALANDVAINILKCKSHVCELSQKWVYFKYEQIWKMTCPQRPLSFITTSSSAYLGIYSGNQ